jgi:hypothetical protein
LDLRFGVRGEKKKFEHPLTLSLHGKPEEDARTIYQQLELIWWLPAQKPELK